MGKHNAKNYFDQQGNLLIKPYRFKDLLSIYGVSKRVLKRWMEKYRDGLGEKEGDYYSIRQVELLVEKIGLPRKIMLSNYDETKQAA